MFNPPKTLVRREGPAFESVVAALGEWPNSVCLDSPSGRSILSFTKAPVVRGGVDFGEQIRSQLSPCDSDIDHPFSGGLIGYVCYESGRFFERMAAPKSPLQEPEFGLRRYEGGLCYEQGTWSIAGTAEFHREAEALLSRASGFPQHCPPSAVEMREPPPEEFLGAVEQVLSHIERGDCYQVNVARRLEFEAPASLVAAFLRLRQRHPARFGALLKSEEVTVLSNSPELFLRVSSGRVETVPIKGTRPSEPGGYEALLNSDKECAELTMIVDMARNDLARCCVPGSVQASAREVLTLPSVFHAQQGVEGQLRGDCDAVDAFVSCFPPASVTGAPKVKAMELIRALEPVPRGVYTGAIGYFSDTGDACFSVAIRTLVAQKNRAWLHVGSGIVADSDPSLEFDESGWKARAFVEALTGRDWVRGPSDGLTKPVGGEQ